MQVACWPLEWYRGGLRDEDLPRTARAGLLMSSGGLASVLDGGLLNFLIWCYNVFEFKFRLNTRRNCFSRFLRFRGKPNCPASSG
jgi:hypothetical protein